MPKIGETTKPTEPKKPYIQKDGRWRCPCCGSIHHFNSTRKCHNPKCSFVGELERVR